MRDSLQDYCVQGETKVGQGKTEYGYAYRLWICTERFGALKYAYRRFFGAAAVYMGQDRSIDSPFSVVLLEHQRIPFNVV